MTTESTPSRWPCIRATAQGCTIDLLVAPNAKRTACMGLHDGALRVRLAAVPVDGAANEALLKWFAAGLALPRQAVTLLRGESSKRKQVAVRTSPGAVAEWLDRLAGDGD